MKSVFIHSYFFSFSSMLSEYLFIFDLLFESLLHIGLISSGQQLPTQKVPLVQIFKPFLLRLSQFCLEQVVTSSEHHLIVDSELVVNVYPCPISALLNGAHPVIQHPILGCIILEPNPIYAEIRLYLRLTHISTGKSLRH